MTPKKEHPESLKDALRTATASMVAFAEKYQGMISTAQEMQQCQDQLALTIEEDDRLAQAKSVAKEAVLIAQGTKASNLATAISIVQNITRKRLCGDTRPPLDILRAGYPAQPRDEGETEE